MPVSPPVTSDPGSAGRTHPGGRILLVLAFLAITGCRSFDPAVFDRRLREATVDRFLDEVALVHGGFEQAGVTPEGLDLLYRERAVRASSPELFYRVLTEMLISLRDPHAKLNVAPRHWVGPRAFPDRLRFVRCAGEIYVGYPSGRPSTAPGEPPIVSLDPPALDDPRLEQRLLDSYDDSPLRWDRLLTCSGLPVTLVQHASLLSQGRLLSYLTIAVETEEGEARSVFVPRNATRLYGESVDVRLGPRELAQLRGQGRKVGNDTDWHDVKPEANQEPYTVPSALSGGRLVREHVIHLDRWEPALEARALGSVAYLRFSSFGLPGVRETRDAGFLLFRDELADVFEALAGCDKLVLDLRGNQGGAWRCAGHLLSYLLPPGESIPFSVIQRERGWSRVRENVITLERAPVPHLDFSRIVVLTDQSTGSGAELVASALRGRCGATIIGERTAGAEFAIFRLPSPDGSTIVFGRDGGMRDGCESFQGVGLRPDVEVPLTVRSLRERGYGKALRDHGREVVGEALSLVGLERTDYL